MSCAVSLLDIMSEICATKGFKPINLVSKQLFGLSNCLLIFLNPVKGATVTKVTKNLIKEKDGHINGEVKVTLRRKSQRSL